jgi:hypothetical protein
MGFDDANNDSSSPKVLEMRSVENQVVPEDPRFLNENSSAPVAHGESARRTSHSELPHTELSSQTPYTLNFSFEELNTLGLDEGAPRHSNLSWQVFILCHFSYNWRIKTADILVH